MALPSWLQSIEDIRGTLPVLLVEGKDDVEILKHFFDQHASDWRQRFYIAPANGKKNVIEGVRVFHPEWVGVLDRDEWTDEELANTTERNPQIRSLPRFCIESLFCYPDELWAVLPDNLRAGVENNFDRFAEQIYMAANDWVAHGAMWRVLRRLYRDHRLPDGLESQPVTDTAEINRILTEWHNHLTPDRVIRVYHLELDGALHLSREAQIKNYIHGKKFYNQVVVQVLDQLFAGRGADDWLQRFRDAKMVPPDDLTPLLQWIISAFPPL